MLEALVGFAVGFLLCFMVAKENILKQVQQEVARVFVAVGLHADRLAALERCHACAEKPPRKKRRPNEEEVKRRG